MEPFVHYDLDNCITIKDEDGNVFELTRIEAVGLFNSLQYVLNYRS